MTRISSARLAALLVPIIFLGGAVGCASSEATPPTGTGGTGGSGGGGASTGGSSGSGGAAGAGGASAGSGAAATGGTTGGAGGAATAGSSGSGGSGAGGSGGSGGAGATAGATSQGGRGGAGGSAGQGGGNGGATGGGNGGATGGGGGGATGGGGSGGGATTACAGKSYKLCDDFETGMAGALPSGWTALNGFGGDAMRGVGLATDQFHSGAMALKSSSMTPGQQRAKISLSTLGATATKHWGRLFYKVVSPAPRPSSGVIHITMAALQGTTENRVVDTVEQMNGTHQWLFNIPDDSCCTGSAYNWSFDTAWHCAEWYVDVSAQSYRFFTDGTEVTQIGFTGKAAAKMSSYTALAVGAMFYQAPPSPFTIWFDDLAIDDKQIGCQ